MKLCTLAVGFVILEVLAVTLAADAPAVKSKVNLQPNLERWGLQPKAQGRRGTCSVCVTTGAFEYALSRKLDRGMPLSVEYLNWACNQVIGNTTQDRGQFFHHLLQGFDKYGICLDRHMPYEPKFSNTQPSDSARENAQEIHQLGFLVHWIKQLSKDGTLTDDHMAQIRAVLNSGWPICAGSHHSRLIVGYEDDADAPGGGRFFVADSGGSGKFAEVTYEFAREKTYDVFWVELPLEPRAADD